MRSRLFYHKTNAQMEYVQQHFSYLQTSFLLSRYRRNWLNQWQLFPQLTQTFSPSAKILEVLTFAPSKHTQVIKYNWQYLEFISC